LITFCVETPFYYSSLKENKRKDGSDRKKRKKTWKATG
jgi:hypothetical protein